MLAKHTPKEFLALVSIGAPSGYVYGLVIPSISGLVAADYRFFLEKVEVTIFGKWINRYTFKIGAVGFSVVSQKKS